MSAQSQPVQTVRARNQSHTRRNAAKVEDYLLQVEKVHGCARSWALRLRLERGDVTLKELSGR
jgi:hypothetical protein